MSDLDVVLGGVRLGDGVDVALPYADEPAYGHVRALVVIATPDAPRAGAEVVFHPSSTDQRAMLVPIEWCTVVNPNAAELADYSGEVPST